VYTATIRRDTEAEALHPIFKAEDKVFPNNRAHYTVSSHKESLEIRVEATDTKALKAVLNSITTILDIYDKSECITERTT
jgi:tRNA threonylcarbamoyladenosine modification (KEOPS) complex  Pcc1 subunit